MGKIKTAVVTGSNSGIGLGMSRMRWPPKGTMSSSIPYGRDEDHALAGEISGKHGNKTSISRPTCRRARIAGR
jgi:hypothetical protein